MFSPTSCSHCQAAPEVAAFPSCTCGFARYCSPDCRARHWDLSHSAFCPVLQQLRHITAELEAPPPDDDDAWLDYRRNELMLASFFFGGNLPLVVQNCIMWQQVCQYCFAADRPLAVCPDCRAVSHCAQHKRVVLEGHRHACSLLQANQRCARLVQTCITSTGQPPIYLPAQEGDACAAWEEGAGGETALEFPPSWEAFFQWRSCPVAGWNDEERRCYTSTLTWPATLVHGLRHLQDAGVATPAQPPTLRLHLLGATLDCEGQCQAKYEEVLHCLPGVGRLELTLVGPQLPEGSGSGGVPGQVTLCGECQAKGRSMHITFASGKYHDVRRQPPPAPPQKSQGTRKKSTAPSTFDPLCKARPGQPRSPPVASSQPGSECCTGSSGGATSQLHACGSHSSSTPSAAGSGSSGACCARVWEPPHAAFMCDSGLHEDNEAHQRAWMPTVRWLRDAGVPTVLTAYTQGEAQADAAVLDRLGCNVVVRPQENPFRADVPMVDCDARYTVFYANGYILAFHGRA